jgi:hypothetical protein
MAHGVAVFVFGIVVFLTVIAVVVHNLVTCITSSLSSPESLRVKRLHCIDASLAASLTSPSPLMPPSPSLRATSDSSELLAES